MFLQVPLNMESSPAAPGYIWAAHLWRPKSPATTKLMLFCKTLRCLRLLFCRDDGHRAFSPFTFYFVDELRNNFMFMWYRKLCACHSRHHLTLSTVSADMMWNNSVELDDVRTLHLHVLIAKQETCRWRPTNERLLTNVRSECSAIDRSRSFSVIIWTFTTRSCSDHWPIVIVLTRSIPNRSMIVHVLGGAPRS